MTFTLQSHETKVTYETFKNKLLNPLYTTSCLHRSVTSFMASLTHQSYIVGDLNLAEIFGVS